MCKITRSMQALKQIIGRQIKQIAGQFANGCLNIF